MYACQYLYTFAVQCPSTLQIYIYLSTPIELDCRVTSERGNGCRDGLASRNAVLSVEFVAAVSGGKSNNVEKNGMHNNAHDDGIFRILVTRNRPGLIAHHVLCTPQNWVCKKGQTSTCGWGPLK